MDKPAGTASERYRELARGTIESLLETAPEWATSLGDHRFDERLDDLSSEGLDHATAVLWRHRTELAAVDPGVLSSEDAVDLAMLLNEIDRRLFTYNELGLYSWDPLAYNPGEALYPLLTRDVLPVESRLRSISARLRAIPERIAVACRQVEAPPRIHVETAMARNAGVLQMVCEDVPRLGQQVPGLRLLVDDACQAATEALRKWGAFLEERLDDIHRSPRLGPDLYARKLALELASPLSPAVVLDEARRWMGEVRDQLYQVAARYLGARPAGNEREQVETIRDALASVAEHHPDDATLIGALEEAVERCTIAVRSTGVVSIPDVALRAQEMPAFRRGAAGAYCDPAGPLEEGGETMFCIEPPAPGWPPQTKKSFYRAHNFAALETLAVHEVMPGHMVQLAHARQFEGSTIARKILYSGTFVEGWAVHAERLMAERGHGGLPVRLSQLEVQLRVAANAVLDSCVHAADMDEKAALKLMCEEAFQERAEAERKWRRACLTSGQLSTYFVGYHDLAPAFDELGDRSNYDELLAHGSPPPHLLLDLLQ